MKLKVGMRVLCKGEVGSRGLKNIKGTIIFLDKRASGNDEAGVLVEFDEDIKGHCGGMHSAPCGKFNHCWWVMPMELKIIKPTTNQAFEALLHGHITEEEYRQYAKDTFWQKVKNLLKRRRRS